jgi:LAO/AO transport system kinase
MELVDKMFSGSTQALSRLITLVEMDGPEVPQIMREIFPHLGKAYSIGITAPPGGGKSTLIDKLTKVARGRGLSVAIIAMDPTSPFSDGALLGDRLRMQQHFLDGGVFIRSMATRGAYGGLSWAAHGVMKLLDAFGEDIIFVETVGVGQIELDIMEAVDTVVVVFSPEAGDALQTMKAGLMEIGDILVVNKADRQGANQLLAALRAHPDLSSKGRWWQVPILATQAINDVGIEELYQEIERHRGYLESSGSLLQRRREQARDEFLKIIKRSLNRQLLQSLKEDKTLAASLGKVESGEIDAYSAAMEILSNKARIVTWFQS